MTRIAFVVRASFSSSPDAAYYVALPFTYRMKASWVLKHLKDAYVFHLLERALPAARGLLRRKHGRPKLVEIVEVEFADNETKPLGVVWTSAEDPVSKLASLRPTGGAS